MKRKLLFCLSVLLGFVVTAQTEAERKKITETYNIENINRLKAELLKKNIEREIRIEEYLKANNKLSRKHKNNGKSYTLYDVVDGTLVYRTTHNENSAKATRTDKLQTGGSLGLNLNGENMDIGVWDEESALGTHDEFKDDQTIPQSRVVYPEFGNNPFLGTTSDHATHVAGTLIAKGADVNAKGMAPKANLRSYDWDSDDLEAITEAASGLLLSNHSYGVPLSNVLAGINGASNVGAYVADARVWDDIAFNAPYYLAVKSAGNNGRSSDDYVGGLGAGYDKLTGNKTAKNVLVVANADPTVIGNFISLKIYISSSQGPTDDFRVKPDIAGDGSDVYSSVSQIPSGSTKRYDNYWGTSMASPNVAGSCLLLQQYYNQLNSNYMRAATLKGLVCHTALDDLARIGPDPFYGWGLLDAEAAANTIADDNNGTATINELTLNNSATYTYQFSSTGTGPISATICWTDPPGVVSSSPSNVLTPRLVNDLDLRLEDSGSLVSMPWKLDNTNVAAAAIKGDNNVDNIERIDIATSVAGNYTLTVTHKGTLTNGSQAFSLILTGANLTLGVSNKLISNVTVWPNPTNDKLNLNFDSKSEKSTIRLYDLQGREVYKKSLKEASSKINHSIDTKAFYSGVYFLNIQNGNAIFNKKVVIE